MQEHQERSSQLGQYSSSTMWSSIEVAPLCPYSLYFHVFSGRFGLTLPPRYFTPWVQDLGCSLRLPVTTNLTTTATGKSLHVVWAFVWQRSHPAGGWPSLPCKWIGKQQSAGLSAALTSPSRCEWKSTGRTGTLALGQMLSGAAPPPQRIEEAIIFLYIKKI